MFEDGLAKLLNDDVFYDKVVELEEVAKRKEVERETRKAVREQHTEALVAWKKLEGERKERNTEIRRTHQEAVIEWEKERDAAKAEKRQPRWVKPKQPKLEAAIPRPKKVDLAETDKDEEDIECELDGEEDFDS
jgi:hypothetical protein